MRKLPSFQCFNREGEAIFGSILKELCAERDVGQPLATNPYISKRIFLLSVFLLWVLRRRRATLSGLPQTRRMRAEFTTAVDTIGPEGGNESADDSEGRIRRSDM